MQQQGSVSRGRTVMALLCAGALGVGAASALAAGEPRHHEPCGEYPGGTYPGGTYPDGGTYPGGTYPDGEYPPCEPGETTPTTTVTQTHTVTVPATPGTTVAERRLRRTPARVRLELARTVRVPRGGLLAIGQISCPADGSCPPTTVTLGRAKRGAARAALAGSYGRKIVEVPSGQTRVLRLRVKRSAVRTMLRRSNRRLGARLVIANPAGPPIVRNLTLRR